MDTAAAAYPYLQAEHLPVLNESDAAPCTVEGELPTDLFGTFARNTPNPRFEPLGRYHWFDGDGMVHAVSVKDGKATYCCVLADPRTSWRPCTFTCDAGDCAADQPHALRTALGTELATMGRRISATIDLSCDP